MKPFRIFIFFAAVLLLLFLIALLMPQQGVGIVGDLRFSFFSVPELFQKNSQSKDQTVELLLAASTVTDDPEELIPGPATFEPPVDPIMPEPEEPQKKESGQAEPRKEAIPKQPMKHINPANTDSLKRTINRIQFGAKGASVLDPFFQTLEGLQAGHVKRSRILHYGDSQIENDRMTALIRFRLQKLLGGTGTGMVPAVPLYSGHMAYQQEQEGKWLRYTIFGKRDSTIRHNSYGVMGAFASVPMVSDGEWPSLAYQFNTRRRTGQLNRVKIFLHSYVEDASMVFQVNDTIVDTISSISDGFSVADYRHHGAVKDFEVKMNLPEGGRIYAISFESDEGLQVDNIAMRGASGLIFTKMDRSLQEAMMDHLSPGLIILQFGGNVVPYMNAAYYKRAFKRELNFVKELCPGVPVILIGPADMSIKKKGEFISDPNVEPIRDALRAAATESGFAFWDLYEAMGGRNSMPSFVKANPPLGRPDYIHFSSLGANLAAEMFYNALMWQYNQFLDQKREQ